MQRRGQVLPSRALLLGCFCLPGEAGAGQGLSKLSAFFLRKEISNSAAPLLPPPTPAMSLTPEEPQALVRSRAPEHLRERGAGAQGRARENRHEALPDPAWERQAGRPAVSVCRGRFPGDRRRGVGRAPHPPGPPAAAPPVGEGGASLPACGRAVSSYPGCGAHHGCFGAPLRSL